MIFKFLVLTTVTLTRVAAVALATLGQAQGVCSAADGAAGSLTNAANSIGRALQGLAEETNDTGHFYFTRRKLVHPQIN